MLNTENEITIAITAAVGLVLLAAPIVIQLGILQNTANNTKELNRIKNLLNEAIDNSLDIANQKNTQAIPNTTLQAENTADDKRHTE